VYVRRAKSREEPLDIDAMTKRYHNSQVLPCVSIILIHLPVFLIDGMNVRELGAIR
jgi:hypothetical protein